MTRRSVRPSGRPPMAAKREEFAKLIGRGVSISAACRQLGIDRKTGHCWKNGGVRRTNGVTRVVEPIIGQRPKRPESGGYLSEDERVAIADGLHAGKSARQIAADLRRAVSTVTREMSRNQSNGTYRPHAAHRQALARRPRPRPRRLEADAQLRKLVQGYLDQRWSPEQIAHELRTVHDRPIATETIYQALYSPGRCVGREARKVLRTGRPYRRSRRRSDHRRARFHGQVRMIDERPVEAADREEPGHWEGDLIIGAYNRSAIGTLVERTSRFTILAHLDGASRADGLRDELVRIFNSLPAPLRRSLTWDQGTEMCQHHLMTEATGLPVFFCHAGMPWQRPSNENTVSVKARRDDGAGWVSVARGDSREYWPLPWRCALRLTRPSSCRHQPGPLVLA